MTTALFKKQMMEVFSWLYQEKRSGKHRSVKGVAGTVVLYPLYHMGLAAEGDILSMLILTAIVLVAVTLTYCVLSRSFLKLATANRGVAKAVYKEQTVRVGTIRGALLRKELCRFTGSANYMLNCGLGIILMPVSAAALIWKADYIRQFLSMPVIGNCIPLLAAAMICSLTTMNDMAAPSVSLEGKNLWIVQSLPVSGKQVLMAKLELHLLLTCIPAIPLVCVMEWMIKPDLLNGIMLPVVVASFVVLMAEIGLTANLKVPNLHWTSEVIPIKQSTPVAVALFGGWLIVAATAGCYYLLQSYIGAGTFLVCAMFLFIVADFILLRWLMGKGAKIFEQLQ